MLETSTMPSKQVQLANRAGALNDIGFSEFTLKAQAFADAVNGTPHFPDMIEEVARARGARPICQRQRRTSEFHIARSRGCGLEHRVSATGGVRPWLCGKRLAGTAGFACCACGRSAIIELEYDTQAALAEDLEQSAVHEVFLCLDIPKVPSEQQPFQRMCVIAQELAKIMEESSLTAMATALIPVAMENIGKDVQDLFCCLRSAVFMPAPC